MRHIIPLFPSTLGSACIAFVVYLISSIGVAILTFVGLFLITSSIYACLIAIGDMIAELHDRGAEDFSYLYREIRERNKK